MTLPSRQPGPRAVLARALSGRARAPEVRFTCAFTIGSALEADFQALEPPEPSYGGFTSEKQILRRFLKVHKDVCEFASYSFDVKIEGRNACRLGDRLFHNKKNVAG